MWQKRECTLSLTWGPDRSCCLTYFITVKCAHFSCSLHCLPSRSRTVSPTPDVLYLQIHLLRPGQAKSVENSPTMSTGPLNLNHLCKFQWPRLCNDVSSLKSSPQNNALRIKNWTYKSVKIYTPSTLLHQDWRDLNRVGSKDQKHEFPQSIFVQNTDNRVKKSISSCSSEVVKPDLIPQSGMQTDLSFPVTLHLIKQDHNGPAALWSLLTCILSIFNFTQPHF